MINLPEPSVLLTELEKSQVYSDWDKTHTDFLSHFFCQLDEQFVAKTNWEIGFYEPTNKKITVFAKQDKLFQLKPADEVFKKPDSVVEKLELDKLKISLQDAFKLAKQELPKQFPTESVGGGFLILQKYQGKNLWNFTFITKSVKFVNLKFDAISGELVSKDTINLVDKNNLNK